MLKLLRFIKIGPSCGEEGSGEQAEERRETHWLLGERLRMLHLCAAAKIQDRIVGRNPQEEANVTSCRERFMGEGGLLILEQEFSRHGGGSHLAPVPSPW